MSKTTVQDMYNLVDFLNNKISKPFTSSLATKIIDVVGVQVFINDSGRVANRGIDRGVTGPADYSDILNFYDTNKDAVLAYLQAQVARDGFISIEGMLHEYLKIESYPHTKQGILDALHAEPSASETNGSELTLNVNSRLTYINFIWYCLLEDLHLQYADLYLLA